MLEKIIKCVIFGFLIILFGGCQKSLEVPKEATTELSKIYTLKEAKSQALQTHIFVLNDTISDFSIEEITRPDLQNRFLPPSKITQKIKSNTVYWSKLQIENKLANANEHLEWVFSISNTFTKLTLFYQDENGQWIAEINGSSEQISKKKFVPTKTGNWFKLAFPPGKVVTLYFQGENERIGIPPKFQANIQPIDSFYDNLIESKIWSTLFVGFLAMMLIYNLLNFIFIKDSSYLYYSGYLFMVLTYTSYISDDLKDWIGDFVFVKNPNYLSFFKISLYVGLMSYLSFIRSFLDLEHLLPKWDRYFRFLIWLGLPLIFVFVFLAIRYNFNYLIDDRITVVYILLVSISAMIFIYPLWKTKDKKGIFITTGIAILSLGFILTLHSRMTQIPFTVSYLKMGTLLEILIFSMGLAYRNRQQIVDKQLSDFALRESQLLQAQDHLEAERLKELNEFKSSFFTNVSHEFRTPLTVILGMTDRLSSSENDASKSHQLALIKRSGENLLHLINQILDLAKLESKTLKFNYIQGDIISYLRYITESLHSLANAQNLMLRVESEEVVIVMDYDPERMLQIVYNLLSNAINFTPSGGQIVLRVGTQDSRLHISVTDSGVGIPEAELPYLFDRFYQAKNQHHSKTGGTGVGLSLVAQLINVMEGTISVESKLGHGSTFHVNLPITNNGVFEEIGTRKTLSNLALSSIKQIPTQDIYSITNDLNHPHVLVIEDNADVVEYLKACLQDNYVLDYAYNGSAGVEKATVNIPDLIICDVMMPEKDGFEVVEILKNDERTSHIPMILLTAKADLSSRIKGLKEGADAYLSKPFNQEELLVTVSNLLSTRKKLQEKYQQKIFNKELPPANVESINLEDIFLKNVMAVIEDNYSKDDFGLPQLCQKVGMSRSQLFRKMKALTDIAPSDLIRKHRLNKAKSLLVSGDANVSEAAWNVGFKDPSYFSKLYQEEFGEAPSATRK